MIKDYKKNDIESLIKAILSEQKGGRANFLQLKKATGNGFSDKGTGKDTGGDGEVDDCPDGEDCGPPKSEKTNADKPEAKPKVKPEAKPKETEEEEERKRLAAERAKREAAEKAKREAAEAQAEAKKAEREAAKEAAREAAEAQAAAEKAAAEADAEEAAREAEAARVAAEEAKKKPSEDEIDLVGRGEPDITPDDVPEDGKEKVEHKLIVELKNGLKIRYVMARKIRYFNRKENPPVEIEKPVNVRAERAARCYEYIVQRQIQKEDSPDDEWQNAGKSRTLIRLEKKKDNDTIVDIVEASSENTGRGRPVDNSSAEDYRDEIVEMLQKASKILGEDENPEDEEK